MFILVYLRIYGSCFAHALAAVAKNAWTLLLPIALVEAMGLLGDVVGGAGYAGGMILGLAQSAAASVYTYFVAEIVARNRVGLGDFRTSIGKYFWTWLNLFFVLWIISLALQMTTAANPNQASLLVVVRLMELVVLNAAPEVIYQRRTYGGLETIQRSFRFLQECWIEWFIPNGLIIAAVWYFMTSGGARWIAQLPGGTLTFWALAGALLHVVMVFRGFLFEVLDGSTHRQRMFKYGRRE